MPIGINGSGTITGISAGGLPDATITTDEIVNAAVTTAKLAQPLTRATAQASTSGSNIDFSGIPAWVRRITIMFNAVSFTTGDWGLVQIGDSGGLETSGYVSCTAYSGASTQSADSTAGFLFGVNNASFNVSGHMVLTNVSGNIWVESFTCGITYSGGLSSMGGGTKTLSDTLTQLRIKSSGSGSFDNGSINIMYEG